MSASGGEFGIVVNGRPRRVRSDNVQRLLVELGYPAAGAGIAVARNGEVVPRRRWAEERLLEGDELGILGAVQGG